jgi:hypothetical protein
MRIRPLVTVVAVRSTGPARAALEPGSSTHATVAVDTASFGPGPGWRRGRGETVKSGRHQRHLGGCQMDEIVRRELDLQAALAG